MAFRIRLAATALIVSGLIVHFGHAIFGWFAHGQYDVVDVWLMDGLMVSAGVGALFGAWRSKGDRLRRLVLAAGVSSYGLAYVVYHVVLVDTALTFPTPSDFMWLAFYPCAALYLLLALRREIHRARWLWLDAAVNAIALVAAGWALVLAPAAHAAVISQAFTVGQTSYMVGDLILAGILAAVLTASGFRGWRMCALPAAGVLVLAAADTVYAWRASAGIDVTGEVLDPMWATGMLLFGACCWLSSRSVASPRQSLAAPLREAVSPAVALAALIAVIAVGQNPIAEALVFVSIGLVCARLAFTLSANRRLVDTVRAAERTSAEQARTDPLTSLGNWRALEADLGTRIRSDEPFTVVYLDLNGFKSYNDRFGHAVGDALLRRMGFALAAATDAGGCAFRPGGDEFCVVLQGRLRRDDGAICDVLAALTDEGRGFSISPACGIVTVPEEAQDADTALRLADSRMYSDKRSGQKSPAEEMSELLLRVVAEREPGLHEHSADVVSLALGTGRQLGCSGEDLDIVARAAEQHDVGKLAIPDAILLKPGPLDATEWELVRQHPIIGERILAGTPALRPVARVVRSCHEHWDGNGYPDGLAGDQIPLAARIIAVCDAYSAMVADRPYRNVLSEVDAFTELRRCGGRQFDPAAVEAFISSRAVARPDAPLALA